MSSIQDALRGAGIWYGGEDRPPVQAAYARLARLLRDRRVRTVGLVPAADGVAVPAIALGLATSLAAAGGANVAVVDPLGRWSGAAQGATAAEGAAHWYATEWLTERIAVISPVTADPGTVLPLLQQVVRAELEHYLHLVVDLTGFDRLGERTSASALLDGVAVVARTGATRVAEIARALGEFDEERALGVVLTGA